MVEETFVNQIVLHIKSFTQKIDPDFYNKFIKIDCNKIKEINIFEIEEYREVIFLLRKSDIPLTIK